MAGVLGLLLPTIAVLMQPSSNGPNDACESNTGTESPWGLSGISQQQQLQVPSPLRIYEQLDKDIKWFRSIWYYLVLYQLTERNEALWPPAWYECVRLIAARTPCLVSSSSAQGAEFEASFGSSADRLAHSTTAAAELRYLYSRTLTITLVTAEARCGNRQSASVAVVPVSLEPHIDASSGLGDLRVGCTCA